MKSIQSVSDCKGKIIKVVLDKKFKDNPVEIGFKTEFQSLGFFSFVIIYKDPNDLEISFYVT